jgi:hypothetical protein
MPRVQGRCLVVYPGFELAELIAAATQAPSWTVSDLPTGCGALRRVALRRSVQASRMSLYALFPWIAVVEFVGTHPLCQGNSAPSIRPLERRPLPVPVGDSGRAGWHGSRPDDAASADGRHAMKSTNIERS